MALLGKIASALAAAPLNPYGVWVAFCCLLSAAFATLFVFEAGQRSLIAAITASVLVVSAPPFLHRFGHLALLGHFVVIGALYLYLRDRRALKLWSRAGVWAVWLCLAALISVYTLAMACVIYGASQLRRWRAEHSPVSAAVKELAVVVLALSAVGAIAGHFNPGPNTTPFAGGFGYFSMNLASPFWPQRSGLFPGFDSIIDATNGQYEGFNYLGSGAILIVIAAIIINFRQIRASAIQHRELTVALAGLFLFAVSNRVFLGKVKLLDLDYSWRFDQLLGVFRSSGRMFWPVFYALVLFGLIGVLRRAGAALGVALVLACCLLQLVDTNPLRTRLTTLTRHETPRLLDQAEWEARMQRAARVEINPSYQCKGRVDGTANMELQRAAVSAGRPINSVYNARLKTDPEGCRAAAAALRNGPWRDDTLYVFLARGPHGVPDDWAPPRKSCHPFSLGIWCLGSPEGV